MTPLDFTDPDHQAVYVQDAVDERDTLLVVRVLKEIGTLKRVPIALDENPPLSEFLRELAGLGFELRILPRK